MADSTPRSARLCNAGLHTMDPNWNVCPYCEAETRSKTRTQSQPVMSASSGERRTRVGAQAGGGRKTKVMSEGAPVEQGLSPAEVLPPGPGGASGVVDTRRIVGVLITYTWRPEGQLYPVREGKNFIGSGRISSEAGHRQCEIYIPEDSRLSAEHALILCRHGAYEIVDQKTSNGTFLNGDMVPMQGTQLPTNAEILTGATVWTFIQVEPPSTAAVGRADPNQKSPGSDPGPKPKDPTFVG